MRKDNVDRHRFNNSAIDVVNVAKNGVVVATARVVAKVNIAIAFGHNGLRGNG